MNGKQGRIERLRAFQLESFDLDWESNLQRLNVKLQLPTESRFSLVVPAAPPALFNGDVETIKPVHWALVVSLNHQFGSHNVEPSADAQWDYWRNFNRKHWYPRFFRPLTQVASSALGDSVDWTNEREYAASHIIFVELCPYASQRFAVSAESIQDLVDTDEGFKLAAQVTNLLIEEAEPAIVMVNGVAAITGFQSLMRRRLTWNTCAYDSVGGASGGKTKRLWHYEGRLAGVRDIPAVGFPFLRTRSTHNSNLEVQQLGPLIRRFVADGSNEVNLSNGPHLGSQ